MGDRPVNHRGKEGGAGQGASCDGSSDTRVEPLAGELSQLEAQL